MTGASEIFEGQMGFFNEICGGDTFDIEQWGNADDGYMIEHTYIKKYPAEYHSQSAIDAAEQIIKERGRRFTPDEVKNIEIATFRASWEIIGGEPEKWRPQSRETADHSLPYITCACLVDGAVTLRTYDESRFQDEELLSLVAKTTVVPDPELDPLYPASGIPNRVTVTLNDGTDKIFVTGSVNVSRDSNIFSSRAGGSDYVYSGGVGVEYTRKAGWIGVNAGVGLDISRFDKFSGENFQNPRFSAELNKQTGRTTGALNLNAARQSRADAALNSRNTSWNYGAGLNVKYPVIERYTLSGGLGYNQIKYVDNPAFVDLSSYSANLNLFYILSNERDLFAGYRYRFSETSRNTHDTDTE
jgi:hypothetical protein